jgi:CTP synthase
MLHLIDDDAGTPAHYGAQAAIFAAETGAAFMHLPVLFDETRFADACQHVTVDGTLVTSGLVWTERLGGRPVRAASSIDHVLTSAATGDIAVPVHPGMANELRTLCESRGIAVRRYRVIHERGVSNVVSGDGAVVTRARQDAFGRWSASAREARTVPLAVGEIRIALIGEEGNQRDVYPATLAALADAADLHALSLSVRFVPPHDLDDASAPEALKGIDGIVLPGGADMRRVPGQIAAAKYAWISAVPVVGLCLGMQSMTTALARLAFDTDDIDLAETASGASLPSFVPIGSDHENVLFHRLGLQPITMASGTQLGEILGEHPRIRCNHRYKLNPVLIAPLAVAGVQIAARDASGEIADAIEARAHPFFIGMQGHPELSSASGAPHPLLSAFVRAAQRG